VSRLHFQVTVTIQIQVLVTDDAGRTFLQMTTREFVADSAHPLKAAEVLSLVTGFTREATDSAALVAHWREAAPPAAG
jgi:hypothetical protein